MHSILDDHVASKIPASVAVIRGREDGDNLLVVTPLETAVHHLVRPCNTLEPIICR